MDFPLTDLKLERSLVAAAIQDYHRWLAHGLSLEDFSDVECRDILELAAFAHEQGKPVTITNIVGSVKDPAAAAELAVKLMDSYERYEVPPDPDRLRELRRLRGVREHALRAAAHAERGGMDEAVSELEEAQKASVSADGMGGVIDAKELSIRFVTGLQEKAKGKERRIHFGTPLFLEAVGPLVVGSQTVIAADTNVGKTSYAMELLIDSAERNVTCGFISCEDPEDVLGPKLVGAYSGLSSRELQLGNVSMRDHGNTLSRALNDMERIFGKLLFAFPVGGSELDVCGAMSRMADQGARVVCVDYVQTIEASKRQQDRRNEVRWLSARLKAHANRIGVALVLISQIARPPKGEESREPTKHDIKDSGDVTNASESIVLLWREQEYDGATINVKLAKSKIGNVGATWSLARDSSARLREVTDSYSTALANQRKREQSHPSRQRR